MAHISPDAKIPRRHFWDISQLTNWIVDLGETCHITPEISDFILGSLVETDKYIEVADENFFTEKQTGEFEIKMCDDNGRPLIFTLYNVIFAPNLRDWILSIITLIHSGHNWLCHKGCYTVFFSDN